ncbi:MAG TPA: hypothetical protein VGI16_12425 [Candidatus Acidoferrum sp.]|jgi:hypothetical protein
MFASKFLFVEPPKSNRSLLRGIVLVACLTLYGCSSGMMQTMPVVTPPVPASAMVTFCNNSGSGCSSGASFSLASLRDLNVMVAWENVPQGTHAQTVHIFLPDGNLYQSMDSSFAIPVVPAGSTTTVGSASTTQALPVAGTFIAQRGLTGNWKVTVDLDGQAMSTQTVQLIQ